MTDAPNDRPDERTDDHREREVLDANGPCMACGSPNARIWHTPDGPARLCPPCATLNGIGCP